MRKETAYITEAKELFDSNFIKECRLITKDCENIVFIQKCENNETTYAISYYDSIRGEFVDIMQLRHDSEIVIRFAGGLIQMRAWDLAGVIKELTAELYTRVRDDLSFKTAISAVYGK